MMEQEDALYMRRALELAARGLGLTHSNPLVGAVLVYNGRIIGEGFHAVFGGPHAEVACLQSVPDKDRALIPESVLYVTLEPCAHFGKTPPCADRIVAEGIRRVVVCNDDPFPRVDGRGYARLRDAGVALHTGLLADEGRRLNCRFFCAQETQRPYIILKWAESADGYIAPENRARTQLSNSISQRLVHQWRTAEQAIMVGTNTALHDNPRLNARLAEGPQPIRIFVDNSGRVPHTHHLFDGALETWVVSATEAKFPETVRSLVLKQDHDWWPRLFGELLRAGTISMIVEGGSALLGGLIGQGLWDEARVIRTPVVLGSGVRAPQLSQATLTDVQPLGQDRLECWMHEDVASKQS